jgi:hypothetical protein
VLLINLSEEQQTVHVTCRARGERNDVSVSPVKKSLTPDGPPRAESAAMHAVFSASFAQLKDWKSSSEVDVWTGKPFAGDLVKGVELAAHDSAFVKLSKLKCCCSPLLQRTRCNGTLILASSHPSPSIEHFVARQLK